jgi:hypothetical protein
MVPEAEILIPPRRSSDSGFGQSFSYQSLNYEIETTERKSLAHEDRTACFLDRGFGALPAADNRLGWGPQLSSSQLDAG